MCFIFKSFSSGFSSHSYQYYLINCVTEHHFIGIWAEFYRLGDKKHMKMGYPTNQTDIVCRDGGGQILLEKNMAYSSKMISLSEGGYGYLYSK